MKQNKPEQRRKNRIGKLMRVLCCLVIFCGIFYFAYGWLEDATVNREYDEISREFHSAQAKLEGEEPQDDAEADAFSIAQKEDEEPAESAELQITAGRQASAEELDPNSPYQIKQDDTAAEAETEPADDEPDPFALPAVQDMIREDLVIDPQFEDLYAQNNDLAGWIQVADCADYPVLWKDNTFYMDHDFYGNSSNAGAIFLDGRNARSMTDSAMLIYGHNMNSGAMFGNLDNYRDVKYLCEYPIISLQSAYESQPKKYVLVSLFDASMNKSDPSYIRIIRTAFENVGEKKDFIAEMCGRSMYDIPIETSPNDQLLTLVTCSYSHDNGRFLLFARRMRENETEASIKQQFSELLG